MMTAAQRMDWRWEFKNKNWEIYQKAFAEVHVNDQVSRTWVTEMEEKVMGNVGVKKKMKKVKTYNYGYICKQILLI